MNRFSLIIPVYNVKDYIEECLDSCIQQTYPNIEIICIDDCSTDGSLDILYEYQNKDTRIKVIKHKKNMGLGGARNTGIEFASGEYTWFVDSDDKIEKDACEKVNKAIIEYSPDLIIVGLKTIQIDVDEEKFPKELIKNNVYVLSTPNLIINYLLEQEIISACLKIIKTTILKKNFRFLLGTQVEDLPTIYIATKISKMAIVPEYLYLYRRNRPGSITAVYSEKFDIGYIKNYNYLVCLLDNGAINISIVNCIKASYCKRAFEFNHVYRIWTKCKRKIRKNYFLLCVKLVSTLDGNVFNDIIADYSDDVKMLYSMFRSTTRRTNFTLFDIKFKFISLHFKITKYMRKIL